MLKSKLHFCISILTFALFAATLLIANNEAGFYVEEKSITDIWKSENWTTWKNESK